MLKSTDFIFLFFPLYLCGQVGQQDSEYFKSAHHEFLLLSKNVNTKGPDIAPFRYAAKLYFSKLENDGTTGKGKSRIYSVYENGEALPFEINPNDENVNIAHTSFTKTGARVYYTLYEYGDNKKIEKSHVCFRDRRYDGKWGPVQKLKKFGSKKMLASQPAIGFDRASRSEILFFVAEMEGGKGKLDIWACYKERDGSFSPPFNLPINTPEDDMSPFFDVISQTLFFSSKGHGSFGGFDVFRSQLQGSEQWSEPQNLGRPINSYHDEVFFTFFDRGKYCYFSSNRPNPTCPKNDPDCSDFDLYQINLKTTVQVFLFDEYDFSHLKGCNLELKDLTMGQIVTTYLNLENNFASFGLKPGREYQIIVSKIGYQPIFKNVRADDRDFFKPGFLEIHLRPMGAQAMEVVQKPEMPIGHFARQTTPVTEDLKPNETVNNIGLSSDTSIIAYSEISENAPMPYPTEEEKATPEFNPIPENDLPNLSSEDLKTDVGSNKSEEAVSSASKQDSYTSPEKVESIELVKPKNETAPTSVKNSNLDQIETIGDKKGVTENYSMTQDDVASVERVDNSIQLEIEKIAEEGATANYIEGVKEHFLSIGKADYLLLTNMPQISLRKGEDPIDLLFSHRDLQCLVAFDIKNEDFQPDNLETMNRYLRSIDGLLKEDQRAPIGITFFKGEESKFVVYSFWDSNAHTKDSSFIHTFLFPEHYRGVLPDPAVFVKLVD